MQRVLITGAASGLGRELALAWARCGARVACADLAGQAQQETADLVAEAGAEALALDCDVRNNADWAASRDTLRARWGGIDVLVNNAGVGGGGGFTGLPDEEWDWLLDINLRGVIRGCQHFVPDLQQQGHGGILNIASMAGLLNPPGMSHYNVAKAGVVALSESLLHELGATHPGIQVSVACPSFFATNLLQSFRSTDPRARQMTKRLFERAPLSAAQVAAAILTGFRREEFLLLPHKDGRLAWRVKRFAYPLYRKEMRRFGHQILGDRNQ